MPEHVRIDADRGIIFVESRDTVSVADIHASIAEVEKIFAEKGLDKTLVDARNQNQPPSITELYEIASNMPRGIRIALLTASGTPTEDGLRFLETVAKNTGLEVVVFLDEDEALRWLNH
jgi:hypothetical protein